MKHSPTMLFCIVFATLAFISLNSHAKNKVSVIDDLRDYIALDDIIVFDEYVNNHGDGYRHIKYVLTESGELLDLFITDDGSVKKKQPKIKKVKNSFLSKKA